MFNDVKVELLRKFLLENDYDDSVVVKAKKSELINTIEGDELTDDFEAWLMVIRGEDVDEQMSGSPVRGTKEWNEYVLGLFSEDEKVQYRTSDEKTIDAVRADGLRRVGEKVLGRVLFSGPVSSDIQYSGPKGMPCAWVQYKIVVENTLGQVSEYQSLGEVSYLNTEDAFLAFALLTAETRAKGRAWREALGVKTYAIEEFSGKKDSAAAVNEVSSADWREQPINTAQQRTIKNISSKLNVDVIKLLNSVGKLDKNKSNFLELKYDSSIKDKYDSLDHEDLTNYRASLLIRGLNQMQQGVLKIDESLLLKNN